MRHTCLACRVSDHALIVIPFRRYDRTLNDNRRNAIRNRTSDANDRAALARRASIHSTRI